MNSVFMTATAAPAAGGGGSMLIILIAMLLIMWLLMIRPEKKKQQKVEAMRKALTVGDQIVTIGGIVGKVVHVTEDELVIETGEDRVRLQIKKWAVSTNVKAEAAEAKEKEKK